MGLGLCGSYLALLPLMLGCNWRRVEQFDWQGFGLHRWLPRLGAGSRQGRGKVKTDSPSWGIRIEETEAGPMTFGKREVREERKKPQVGKIREGD